jgi:peptidoglycan hydrolase CwlO-like protein
MSQTTEEKIGLILGKVEALHEYTRDMNHDLKDTASQTQLQIVHLEGKLDETKAELEERIDDLEDTKRAVVVMGRTLKVVAVTVLATLTYNWAQLKKFFIG